MKVRKRVLIADANEEFRAMLAETLEGEARIEVIGSTGDGREALAKIQTQRPHLVVMDLVLSGLDGLAMLEQLPTPRPGVLVVSSFVRGSIADLAAEKGADYYMVKPCSLPAVAERIRLFLAGGGRGPHLRALSTAARQELERQVTELLHEIGVPAHIRGYHFVREAICIAVEDIGVINAVTKVLYPEVGRRFGSTATRVERAIRHAIELAWDRGDLEALQTYFGYTVSHARGKPTNGEFIAIIADRFRLRLEEM